MLTTSIPDPTMSPFLQERPTIVVADDDPDILDAMKMMLEFYNFKVEIISDGVVVPKLKKIRPKLLLLDIYMSGADGRKICKELKSQSETRDIPVIMISASCELRRSMQESGANDCLEKPFNMEDLITKIGKYVPNHLSN